MVDVVSHITWYTVLKLFFLSYDFKSLARWSVDRSWWWRSTWRRRTWWTGRGLIASVFLALVMFTSWTPFAGWFWSTWNWWWWWVTSSPSSLFLLLWWLWRVVLKVNYLIVRWRLLDKDCPFSGWILLSLTTIVCHHLDKQ